LQYEFVVLQLHFAQLQTCGPDDGHDSAAGDTCSEFLFIRRGNAGLSANAGD